MKNAFVYTYFLLLLAIPYTARIPRSATSRNAFDGFRDFKKEAGRALFSSKVTINI